MQARLRIRFHPPALTLTLVTALALALVTAVPPLAARPFRVDQIPNGALHSCDNCHVSPGGPRNDFGRLIEQRFLSEPGANGNVMWGALLASYDADMDGVANGDELQDRYGEWSSGDPAPGDPGRVTLPGMNTDVHRDRLTLQFDGMDPHVGQKFEARVIDKSTGLEAGRLTIDPIPGGSFTGGLDVLLDGDSYAVDFYADLNGNGAYDPPPADHAWRIDLDGATGDTTLAFTHNTNFTDIDWPYLLTLDLSGMDPHIGQTFEARVVDDADGSEAGRRRVQWVSGASFAVEIPGIRAGHDYTVDFYADLNGNGRYDAPPADHAWRRRLVNVAGDETLAFAHDTNFTDVEWAHLFRMNLVDMDPHVGQLFELRVVDEGSQGEAGRTRVEPVAVPRFSAFVPGLDVAADYRADFYADLNMSGGYDVPPTDHAWRVLFSDAAGDVAINFAHNTDFVDIEWPAVGIGPGGGDGGPVIPRALALAQNRPNPFNPSTTISFTVPEGAGRDVAVRLAVYDVRGRMVATLLQRLLAPGGYAVTWSGRDGAGRRMPSGVYFARLEAGGSASTRKMVMAK